MKKETIHLIKMLSKRALYGFIIQCIFYGFIMADPGSAQSIKDVYLTLNLKDATLKQTFKAIEHRTDFRFSYARKNLDNNIKITNTFEGKSLETVLIELSKTANLKFKRINNNIVVDNKEDNEKVVEEVDVDLAEQQISITGVVYAGTDSEPLPGVSIILKGTATGTTTDLNGKFSMEASQEDVLVFSYIGYVSQEVTVGTKTNFTVTLEEDLEQLEEVIVVGYGTQEKRDVTAAIGSVSAKEISELPVSNAVSAMQGRVAGVDITPQGGRPGQNATIRIRGRRSINASNDPLYVVDGIPLSGSIFDFNQQNIESIEVLKDAAATAIYGSRGANGVILITTKRGKAGTINVSYDGYYGVSKVINQVDMMNGPQFADMKRESRRRDADGNAAWDGTIPSDDIVFEDPVELISIEQGRSTDYQDLIFSQGSQNSHQVSISGGSENTTFSIAGGYFKEEGIIKTMDFTRYTLSINVDQKIGDRIRIGTSTMLSRSIQNWASNPVGEALSNNPLGVPYDDEGNLIFLPIIDGIRTNPLAEIVDGAYLDERKFNRIFASIYGEFKIAEGLKYRVNVGPDIRTRRRGLFQASMTNARRGAAPNAGQEYREEFAYTLENILTYNKQLGINHDFGVTLLQSIQEDREENTNIFVTGLPYESQEFYNIGSAEEPTGFGSNLIEWSLASYMGRVNYSYKDKYLFQFTLRADGSSRLADENKWSYFPGVSLGWRVIDEPFMAGQTFFDELKLRASYGQVGNTSIDPYRTQGRLANTTYVFGSSPAFGYRLNEIPNDQLGWERTSTTDVGLDFGILGGRISGSMDFYVANTTDLLLEFQLPYTSGYNNVLQNVGATRNTGFELTLSTVNFDSPSGFRWTTDINWFTNKEEIVELYNGAVDDPGNNWFIGEPLNVFYDYQKAGIWQANEAAEAAAFDNSEPGYIKVADLSGPEGVPDGKAGPEDRTIIGTDVPDWSGGITNRFEYKGFDLSFFFFARWGQTIRSRFHDSNNSLFARYNNLNVDYWTIDNPTNAYPRPNLNQERPRYVSTLRYFDGSFIKLRNINLGYNFPSSITEKLKVKSLRVYASAQTPWYYAKYESFDPETDGDIEAEDLPSNKLFLMGLNISF
ncbi:SusC/RagA family TonB-linked outer membrane protein [Chondrinema litorale]|uniref:SusC/RagA family TonB-linked outer membrane protein n=1 Tax=Chondrinema litorale TaxID=2994555 RepID=UPI002543606F|nr:SusC/RagA family TonB-linked outer membrane protein [Chondrinema litorale]UZR99917.1 SusC/RagA family TonB-linked outer membrane protein [Chondrinema litorale]